MTDDFIRTDTMGHYRSEMGYEEEDARRADLKAERMARITANIDADVKERGIAIVLAEILDDPFLYKLGVDH
jgi:hypothetical protein